MNKKDFIKLEVLIPSYDEQKRIAQVLKSADKEIELLQKELEAKFDELFGSIDSED